MKKFIISLAVIGLITAGASKVAKAENEKPCKTISSTCPSGVSYTAIVCEYADALFWDEYYCGISPE